MAVDRRRRAPPFALLAGHDDDARSVLADWLENEGRGEERTALLAMQWRPCGLGADPHGLWACVEVGGEQLKLRWIPPGSFTPGAPSEDHEPEANVDIAGFWLAEMACRQREWLALMGVNPSHDSHPERPVEQISWHDARAFGERASARTPGLRFDLPSEHQWEYACRARSAVGVVLEREALDRVAWWGGNSERRTHPVGLKAPNAWGLYDMLGNVGEWCLDLLPRVEGERAKRAVRGGSWASAAEHVRAEVRSGSPERVLNSGTGFRISAMAISV